MTEKQRDQKIAELFDAYDELRADLDRALRKIGEPTTRSISGDRKTETDSPAS